MRSIFTVILFFTLIISYGQSFEGTLTYVADFEISPKLAKMGMTKQSLLDKMKSEGSWADTIRTTYKQGNYISIMQNSPKSRMIYRSDSNKIYSMQDGEDVCTVTDAAIDIEFTMTGKMPTIQKLDTAVMIDGLSCSIVRVKWKTGSYDYYFNSTKMPVDPALYTNCIYEGWNSFLKISNALPLKIVKTTKGMMTATMILISAKEETFSDKIFSIPVLVPDAELNIVKLAGREVKRIKK